MYTYSSFRVFDSEDISVSYIKECVGNSETYIYFRMQRRHFVFIPFTALNKWKLIIQVNISVPSALQTKSPPPFFLECCWNTPACRPHKNCAHNTVPVPKTKVSITLVPEELQTFFWGFFGVAFDFQSIGTMYNPVVCTVLGGQWAGLV